MPKDRDPKGGLSDYYRKSKFPKLKGPVSRIKPVKPIKLERGPFVLKRRGIRLPLDFTAYQESRAVPRSRVYGTLPERIVYKEFRRRRFDFDFQTSLLGGRQQLGGKVADYILWLPYGPVIVRCQSYAFHAGYAKRGKDEEDKRILEALKDPYTNKYYVVYDLWEDVIFAPERLAEWIDRNLIGNYQGQAMRAPWAEVEWMPSLEEWNAALAQIDNLVAWNEGLQEQITYLITMIGGGQVGPDFVIDNMNIRNLAVTDAKINDLAVGKITAGNIDVAIGITTGGSIQIGTGTKDSNLTGWIIDPNEIVGQASGADKFKIDASTGLITIYAGNAINGTVIDNGTLPPIATNFEFHIMDGTFSDDSPSAGSVAWASVDIIYDGTKYDITNGNTDKKYIYWDKSASTTTFQVNDTKPTLIDEDFLACINASGTAIRGDSFSHIEGAKIRAATITADEITGTTLSAIYADLGTITAGNINMFTGTWDSNATGFRLTADEICGQAGGADQVVLLASTGKLTAGGGNVGLDATGLGLTAGAGASNQVTWFDSGDGVLAYVVGDDSGGQNILSLQALGTTDGEADGVVRLQAIEKDGAHWVEFYATAPDGGSPYFKMASSSAIAPLQFNDTNTEIWEDASSNLSFKDANAGTKILSDLWFVRADKDSDGDYDSLTSTSWDGDAFAAGTGTINWNTVFGVPTTAKAVLVDLSGEDETVGAAISLQAKSTTTNSSLVLRTQVANKYIDAQGVVPIQSDGTSYYNVVSEFDAVYLRVVGWYV